MTASPQFPRPPRSRLRHRPGRLAGPRGRPDPQGRPKTIAMPAS
ncbi:hypothetical protein ACRAWD_21370 [Caulobacter segnis]